MAFTPCTFSVTLKDISDASVMKDVFVRFELKNYGTYVPTVPGVDVIVPSTKDYFPDANGNINASIIGNDVIYPSGTYYTISFWAHGECYYKCDTTITGSSVNLDNITCGGEYAPQANCECKFYLGFYAPGCYLASQIVLNLPLAMSLMFPANALGSFADDIVNATATAVFIINKISGGVTTEIGTLTFSPGSSTGVFAVSTPVTFNPGDIFQIVAPATPDATLAGVSATLVFAT
jgi:hypothetical protein